MPESTGNPPADAGLDSRRGSKSLKLGQILFLALFWAIQLSFYVSTLATDSYKYLYPQGEIQDIKTLDYSQVPNGAKTFFQMQSARSGRRPPPPTYIPGAWTVGGPRPEWSAGTADEPTSYPGLQNVYHPIFTLVVGGVLQVFRLDAGFTVFTLIKLVLTVYWFRWLFAAYHSSAHFLFAAFVMLCHFSQSVEIGSGQYHFLLNGCIFMFLWGSVTGRSQPYLALWYGLSLFVKPLALLWVPMLLMRRTILLAIVPVVMFFAATVLYYMWSGELPFYIENLLMMTTRTLVRPTLPRYSISGIVAVLTAYDSTVVTIVKYLAIVVALVLTFRMRKSMILGVFTWTCYFLLFYSLVYEYHYTTLIPVLVLGILRHREFQGWWARVLIVWICLPSPFLLFKAGNLFPYVPGSWEREIGSDPVDLARNLSDTGMCVLMGLKVLPVLLLLIHVWLQHERLGRDQSLGEPA